ncbi:hypothetical protein [Actinomadura roseirufa]|nr:hypothetical protein [Actinomadura roseirufa]
MERTGRRAADGRGEPVHVRVRGARHPHAEHRVPRTPEVLD